MDLSSHMVCVHDPDYHPVSAICLFFNGQHRSSERNLYHGTLHLEEELTGLRCLFVHLHPRSFLSSLLKIQTGTIHRTKTPAPKNREKAESH